MSLVDSPPTLRLSGVDAFYGKTHVLHEVSIHVWPGEIVSVLGRNGSGRSTLLKAVMGLAERKGSIRLNGAEVSGLAPFRLARLGVGYVPEGREVFGRLSVEQNLLLGSKPVRVATPNLRAWTLDDMYRLFPLLRERRRAPAGVLSGGEQQMLTLCRTLMGNPELMLIDEPTEGLAPALVEQVGQFLLELQARGVSVLLVEQKLNIALAVSQRCYLMGRGSVVFEGTTEALAFNAAVRAEWLEV